MARKKNETENRKRILKKAFEYFSNYGYSRTNIEDIINDLGMGRKTLYDCFNGGKQEILKEVIEEEQNEIEKKINEILLQKTLSLRVKFKQIIFLFLNSFYKCEKLIQDLNNNYPELLSSIRFFKKKNILDKITLLLEEGQKKGIVKKEIPIAFIIDFILQAIENKSFYDLFSLYSINLSQANEIISNMVFEGIELEKI